MYHYTDGGLRNVWLANAYEIKKTLYGEAVAFHNLDGLTRSICMALTRKASLLTGAEFRYIRMATCPCRPACSTVRHSVCKLKWPSPQAGQTGLVVSKVVGLILMPLWGDWTPSTTLARSC